MGIADRSFFCVPVLDQAIAVLFEWLVEGFVVLELEGLVLGDRFVEGFDRLLF